MTAPRVFITYVRARVVVHGRNLRLNPCMPHGHRRIRWHMPWTPPRHGTRTHTHPYAMGASPAVASPVSCGAQGTNRPNTICCTTGNFPTTSANQSRTMPSRTFRHSRTPLTSQSMGEWAWKGPCFTVVMWRMASR